MMKNLNIMGIYWKILFLKGRGFTKKQYIGGKGLKSDGGELGQFASLRGA